MPKLASHDGIDPTSRKKLNKLLDKEKIAKLKFSEKITENDLSKKSFVQKLLTSIKEKMYANRK